MRRQNLYSTSLFAAGCLLVGLSALASDHDDGEMDLKGRALNLTDVYVFREDNQTGNANDQQNLVLIMNSNPRSLPGQQYYFSTQGIYNFHLTRVKAADKTKKPTGNENVVLRFKFGAPGADRTQAFTMSLVRDGKETVVDKDESGRPLVTTNIDNSKADSITQNRARVDNLPVDIFAGLRQDPFFFDVEQFFKVRAEALKSRRFIGFLPANQAKDFTHNYNVNTIVVRVPLALLRSGANEPVFDVWTTITVPPIK